MYYILVCTFGVHVYVKLLCSCADQDIGYGPTSDAAGAAESLGKHNADDSDFHPPTPPVMTRDGEESTTNDVVKFDSNFIMVKKDQQGSSVAMVSHLVTACIAC